MGSASDTPKSGSGDAGDGGSGAAGLTYAGSGVDIEAGNALVRRISPFTRMTARPGSDAAIGGFGGVFDPKAAGYADPLLVSATDGVGTKLLIAIATGRHETVGQDLVAMCVNDLLVHGAEPLYFLDYFATGRLDPDIAGTVIEGIAHACAEAGCALVGGETAEMPAMYAHGHYDLAGFAVGAVERGTLLPRGDVAAGDRLIALASNGLHSNGFSLVRRVVEAAGLRYADAAPFAPERSLGEALLVPTHLYVRPLLGPIRAGRIKALAHITGGGVPENLPRVLPEDLEPKIDTQAGGARPAVFDWLQDAGRISDEEMALTFNCGVGMVLVVAPGDVDTVLGDPGLQHYAPWVMGELAAKAG